MANSVLYSIVGQIEHILYVQSASLGELRDDIQQIADELRKMKGFLNNAEAIVENAEHEAWVSQVRDAAYDVEDALDILIPHGDALSDRLKKLWDTIKNYKARRQIIPEIHTIKDRIILISKLHEIYRNQYGIFVQDSSSVMDQNQYQRRRQLFLEEEEPVGIELPKKKIMRMLLTNESQLRIISVVGIGGVGKTTLVKEVYNNPDVRNQFKHHVWITVSKPFKLVKVLKQAIQQLCQVAPLESLRDRVIGRERNPNYPAPQELDTMDIDSMVQLLHSLLQPGNCIIVFDDIWTTTDWEAIQMVFPSNNDGTRIIITTQIFEVGQVISSEFGGNNYCLEPLTGEDSLALFRKKAFSATSIPDGLEEISNNIIDKCDGLPLAIVVIAGALATKKVYRNEEWDLFNRNLVAELARNNHMNLMAKFLSRSYYDLPDHLRICFLYLSILPEDVSIQKKRLIRLWIAEGFVKESYEVTLEEVAEGYLDELVNRNLVQVAQRTGNGRLKACYVHHIVHQFIIRKAREQDITTLCGEHKLQFSNKVRRLVVHKYVDNTQVSNSLLKCLRSLIIFKSFDSIESSGLLKLLHDGLRLLKVLEWRGAPLQAIPNEIFSMFRLKYLSLRYTQVKIVSDLIGNLRMLETLDLRNTYVTELPVEIVRLQNLRHLLVGSKLTGFNVRFGIRFLGSLQSLSYIILNKWTIDEIRDLKQLRRLGVILSREEDHDDELRVSLQSLKNSLRSVRVVCRDMQIIDSLDHNLFKEDCLWYK